MLRIASAAAALHTALGKLPEEINRRVRVVRRRRRFDPTTLAQAFVLAFLRDPTPKDQDVADIAASLGVPVSAQAIEQRYTPALTAFFRELFERMAAQRIATQRAIAPLLGRFSEILVIDSSGIKLPASLAPLFPGCGGGGGPAGGNEAALKLQTELDLRSGSLRCVQLESGCRPDQGTDRQAVPPKPGGLRIADLGYFSVAVLAQIVAARAHFLSRIQFQTRLEVDGHLLSAVAFLRGLAAELRQVDCPVHLGRDERLACRLIAFRVPEAVAARRRQKLRAARRKRGDQPSVEALDACGWYMLVSDLGEDRLSVAEAVVLYRSRWQIELLFKRWKSLCRIDLLDGRSDEHSMARLWIRLCAAVVQHYLVVGCCWRAGEVPSFAKVAARLRDLVEELCAAITSRGRIARLIEKLICKADQAARRTKRRKKPGWIELLRDPQKLEYALT